MTIIDAVLEALSHAGELFVGTEPEGKESKRALYSDS
jgi:hypothetical protein